MPITKRHVVVFAVRIAGWTIALAILGIALAGLPYYTKPLAGRVRDPLHSWLRPSGTVGQSLGILALCLFLFLWLYPLRKKLARVPSLGSLPRWLDVHVVAGLLVPLVAAVHAGFRCDGLIGLGYLAMAIVCASGIIGRYLYAHIPRSRSGIALTLDEVGLERRQLLHDLARTIGRPVPEVERRLVPPAALAPTLNPLRLLVRMGRGDLARRHALRHFRAELAASGVHLDGERSRQVLASARREMALAQQAVLLEAVQRLFRWWHAAHRPFAVTALVAVLLHVAVAVMLGQTWFR
ncbi:MAG TPA: hypothetical protein VFV75_10200 [Candidatus Polarisedimenticolaceae bacterium]|nr:hypothetical protein [Candidatus Polarisedimenticolaceae bacterium]